MEIKKVVVIGSGTMGCGIAAQLCKWAKTNYGNSAVPKWNFHKILINKDGKIEETFSSFTNPTSQKIIRKIEELLQF